MKGISAIIGTILILMITLALVSVSYFYIFGIYTTKTLVIEGVGEPEVTKNAVDTAKCDITWKVRNLAVDTVTVSVTSVNDACTEPAGWASQNIVGGQTLTFSVTSCARGQNHVYKVAGPSNTVNLIAYCA